jgi:putative tricarboxylic transport membrane protein
VQDPSSPAAYAAPAVRRELAAAAVLIAFGLYIISVARRIPLGVATDPLGPRFFPIALGAMIAICGALLVVGVLLARGRPRGRADGESDPDDDAVGAFSISRLAAAIALTALYLVLFEPLGYLLATPLYVLSVMLLHRGAPPRMLVLTPVLVTVTLYLVFKYGLLIPVPDGILEPLLRPGG